MALGRSLRSSCLTQHRFLATSSRSSPTAFGVQLDAVHTTKVFRFFGHYTELFKPAQVAGRKLNFHYALGYPVAKAFANVSGNASSIGPREREPFRAVFVPSPKELDNNWDDNTDRVIFWLKRLLVPALAVLIVVMGWEYPCGLILNLLVLVWASKPSPASLDVWLEKRRTREAKQKSGFQRFKEQLKFSPVHVHVEDHILYRIAKVRSLAGSMILIGCLGDWWVLHSSSFKI